MNTVDYAVEVVTRWIDGQLGWDWDQKDKGKPTIGCVGREQSSDKSGTDNYNQPKSVDNDLMIQFRK